jgi:hypothetical protein
MNETDRNKFDEFEERRDGREWNPDVSPQLRNRIEEALARAKSEAREKEARRSNIENELPVLKKKEFSYERPQVIQSAPRQIERQSPRQEIKLEAQKEIKREVPPPPQKKIVEKRRGVSPFRLLVLAVIFLLISVGVVYGGFRVYQIVSLKNNPDSIQSVLSEVGKLVILPEGEVPSMATVTNVSELGGQEFFAKAEIGDKVLIFNKSKKAILYRPSTQEIVEIAPLIQ